VPSAEPYQLLEAVTAPQITAARALIREYAAWINVDLCFQEIDAEIDGLPGKYRAERGGALLLACRGQDVAGCVALRALEPGICEMKRLWVRESHRGAGLGELLVQAVLERARGLGYALIRLDTLSHMARALKLYRRFGFREIPAYYDNPLAGVVYLQKSLSAPASTDPAMSR
jgi:ribosomal protein S18 acetylase RimI-like enzyme